MVHILPRNPPFAPLGYLNVDGPDGKKIIVPDPDVAPAIRSMFERYATGQHSLKAIARLARADGLVYRKSGNPVPTSTVHKIRKRAYTGDYDYNGVTNHGGYEPIVSTELWEEVQAVLDGRQAKRPKKRTHDFAFSGLITCGLCGCAMVGELKKGRYVYYHCTDHKASAQDRIDAMYMDKLDARIDNAFFDRKASEFRSEQCRIMRDIEAHRSANQSYIEEGIRLLGIAHQAHEAFESQPPAEKRKMLDFVLSNCTWQDGQLTAEYRQPFDFIAAAAQADRQACASGGSNGSGLLINNGGRP